MRSHLPEIRNQYIEGRISRREFMRLAAMLGLSAPMASAMIAGCAPAAPQVQPTMASQAATAVPAQLPTATVSASKRDKTRVVIGVSNDASTLDPQVHTALNSAHIYTNMFDLLVGRDPKANMVPSLALSWTPLDNTTWELKLRQGVKFSNGDPFSAEDVKFFLDRVMDPNIHSFYASRFELVQRVEIADPYTVRIFTKGPFPVFPPRLTEFYPVPKKYFETVGAEYFNEHPIGTGPYKLVEWKKGDQITLEANNNYWGGVPEIKRVVFRVIPEPSTRVSELLTGGIDFGDLIPIGLSKPIKSSTQARLVFAPNARVLFYFLDMTKPELPTYDVRVRQAMNYAVDKQSIVDELWEGHAKVVGQRLSTLDVGWDDSIQPYPYDPDKAKKLLVEAGYPDGFSLTCWSSNGFQSMDKETTEAIAFQLAKVGIHLDLQIMETGAWLQKMNSRNLSPMGNAPFASGTFDAYQLLAYNRTGYVLGYLDDAKWDADLDASAAEMDPDKRVALYRNLLKREHDEAFYIFVHQYESIYGVAADLNYTPRADELIRVWDHMSYA